MTVREVQVDDLPAVRALFAGAGWSGPAESDWVRLWADGPAVAGTRRVAARGWLMEEHGTAAGFLGNLPQLYEWDGSVLLAAVAVSFVVAPRYRGLAMPLLNRFIKQPHVDLLLGTSATPEAARLLRFLKFESLPEADRTRACYWVTRPAGFLAAALRKRGRARAAAAATLLAPAFWLADRAARHRPPRTRVRPGSRVDVVSGSEIGAEFDELWDAASRAQHGTVRAVRSRAALAHRFDTPANRGRFVRAWDGRRLVGFAALVRRDNEAVGLKRMVLADLLVERDEEAVAARLVAAAIDEARRSGCDVLEAHGYSTSSVALLEAARPRVRRRDGWPFLYRATSPELQASLAPGAWYTTLFDGDRC